MSLNIKIEPREGGKFEIIPDARIQAMKHRIKDVLDDIADEIEHESSLFAPQSEEADKEGGSARDIPSGALKEHPVDIRESSFGTVLNIPGEAEGFRSVQAPAGAVDPVTGKKIGGQFVKGKATGAGNIFYTVVVSYPEKPFYAKYVAFGTGPRAGHNLIVPHTAPKMRFRYVNKNWALRSTQGQDPQPYLDEAVHAVNTSYIPIKLGQLRAEADSL